MNTIWHRLAAYAQRKIRENFKGAQCQCPNCLRWTSETRALSFHDSGPWHSDLVCGACGHTSVWDMRYMLPVLAQGQDVANQRLAKRKS